MPESALWKKAAVDEEEKKYRAVHGVIKGNLWKSDAHQWSAFSRTLTEPMVRTMPKAASLFALKMPSSAHCSFPLVSFLSACRSLRVIPSDLAVSAAHRVAYPLVYGDTGAQDTTLHDGKRTDCRLFIQGPLCTGGFAKKTKKNMVHYSFKMDENKRNDQGFERETGFNILNQRVKLPVDARGHHDNYSIFLKQNLITKQTCHCRAIPSLPPTPKTKYQTNVKTHARFPPHPT